jgi:hypothetical protein
MALTCDPLVDDGIISPLVNGFDTCGPLVHEGIISPLVDGFDLWTISSRGYHLPISQWL